MKNVFRFVRVLVLSASLSASFAKAQTYVLNFSSKETFGVVFESGLRPKRVPGFESSIVDAKNVDVELIFAEDAVFAFDAAEVAFHVMKDDLMGGIAMTSGRLAIDEARSIAAPLVEGLVGELDRLEAFLSAAERQPITFRIDSYAVSRKVKDSVSIGLSFRKSYFKDQPLIIELGAMWSDVWKADLFLREPIPSPKGWEHVSLDPDTATVVSVDETMPVGEAADGPQRPDSGIAAEIESQDSIDDVYRRSWIYAIVGAVALALLLLGIYAHRKRTRK